MKESFSTCQNQTKLLILTSLGGALEFLDFTIYALFSRYISHNFFPEDSSFIALINTFAIFAIGYFARPIGGIIFGHFGDKYGRKNTFIASAFIMSVSTLLIGFLPTYSQAGMIAPLLLLTLRLLQGISVGGEVPGAITFIYEHYSTHNRGLAIGSILMGVTLGNVIGSGIGYSLTSYLSQDEMLAWGWRIPFLIGSVLGFIAYLLRRKAIETPIFSILLNESRTHAIPFMEVVKTAFPKIIMGMSLTALSAMTVFLFLYLPAYPPIQNRYQASELYSINIISFLSLALFTGLFGSISDYINKKKIIIFGCILSVLIGSFLFKYLLAANHFSLLLFCVSITCFAAMANGCYGYAIAELFPSNIRYSGVGIAYNLGFAVFGGLLPLIVTFLTHKVKDPLTPFYIFAFFALITLTASLKIKPVKHAI